MPAGLASNANRLGRIWVAIAGMIEVLLAIAGTGGHQAIAAAADLPYCHTPPSEILHQSTLLQQSLQGDRNAREAYERRVAADAAKLRACRQQTWPRVQAVWLRLYPCDLAPGQLEQIFDNIAHFGYNRVYLNAFYDGRVLLPQSDNPTVWPSVVDAAAPHADLLARAIAAGKQRGIAVHAWVFTMNFGPSYAARRDRADVLARNGYGETNLEDPAGLPEEAGVRHVFVDPYNERARNDLRRLIEAIARRRPDGIAFDYIRYPHRTQGIVTQVRDLMIYGNASVQALLSRATSEEAVKLAYTYLKDGAVAAAPKLTAPKLAAQWQWPLGAPPTHTDPNRLLWHLVLDHARRGAIDFLDSVSAPARQQNIPTSAVFFPRANLTFGHGVDPRLQPWPYFRNVKEWVPMSYAQCGDTSCIVQEMGRAIAQSAETAICPAIAGAWGRSVRQRPSLEQQMHAIYRAYPHLDCLSHFAYSWFDLAEDGRRRSCRIPLNSAFVK